MAARTRGAALRLCATGTGLVGVVRVGAGTLPEWGRARTGRGVRRDIPHRGSFLRRGLPETSVTRGKDAFSSVRFWFSGWQEVSGALAPLTGVKDATFPRCSHSVLWLQVPSLVLWEEGGEERGVPEQNRLRCRVESAPNVGRPLLSRPAPLFLSGLFSLTNQDVPDPLPEYVLVVELNIFKIGNKS